MLYAVYGLMIFLNLIFAFGKKHSIVITFFTLIFIWMLFWGNTYTYDMYNYIIDYMALDNVIPDANKNEFMFILMKMAAKKIGLNFYMFRFVCATVSYALIHSTVRKYASNYNYVYLFYMLYAMFMDIEQLRNFIAISIFIYAIRYLVDNDKKSKLKYICFILFATTIHNSLIFYLPFVFISRFDKNKLIKFAVCFGLIMSAVTFLNENKIPIIDSIISLVTDNSKIEGYLGEHTNLGFLYAWSFQILDLLLIYWARVVVKKSNAYKLIINKGLQKSTISNENSDVKKYHDKFAFVELVFWMNVIMLCYFPLYMQSMTFYRLIKNIMILNLISCSIGNEFISKKRWKQIVFNLLVFTVIFSWFSYDLLTHLDTILFPIFESSLFLEQTFKYGRW